MPNLIGMDCSKDCTNFAAAIKKAGVGFVGEPILSLASLVIQTTYQQGSADAEYSGTVCRSAMGMGVGQNIELFLS